MKSGVYFESARSRVAFVATAKLAPKWLQTRVCQLVGLQMPLRYESCRADLAREGPLARMRSHVCFQISCFRKLLQAILIRTKQNFLFVLRPRNFLYII